MEGFGTVAHRSLAAGEVLKLHGGDALALEVATGVVWVTLPGRDDVVLEQGNRIALTDGGLAIAEALRPAEVRLTVREAPATALSYLTDAIRGLRRDA